MPTAYRVAAVAYHPRVVIMWEGFRDWFRRVSRAEEPIGGDNA